jgi:hypothetical protein
MYLGTILMFLGTPLALGSFYGILAGLALTVLLMGRIVGEEAMLTTAPRRLSGIYPDRSLPPFSQDMAGNFSKNSNTRHAAAPACNANSERSSHFFYSQNNFLKRKYPILSIHLKTCLSPITANFLHTHVEHWSDGKVAPS